MEPILSTLAWAVCLLTCAPGEQKIKSFLYTSVPGPNGTVQLIAEPYAPHEGDLILYDSHSKWWKFLYSLAFTEPPDHSGMVVSLPDGTPALLEAGPDNGKEVQLLSVLPRFEAFQGTVWVRRNRRPLTKEESERITNFALAQEGKKYATRRLFMQITPFRARGPLRSMLFAKTYMDREEWLCSEILITACTHAGLFNPDKIRANVIYPVDILDDHLFDLSPLWHEAGIWSNLPPPEQPVIPPSFAREPPGSRQ